MEWIYIYEEYGKMAEFYFVNRYPAITTKDNSNEIKYRNNSSIS